MPDSRRCLNQALLLAGFIAATACHRASDTGLPDGMPFLDRDSAGVLVATTLGTRARTPVGWVVDTVAEYQIGEVDGEEPYLFNRIGGAQQLSDGRVVVLDQASCELRFFGTDGVFLEHRGGRGEGPGEFHPDASRCVLVPSPGSDSLRAFDGTTGSTLRLFDDRGRFSYRVRASWDGEHVPRVHGVAGGRVLAGRRFFSMSPEGGVSPEPSTADFALLDVETWEPVWEGSFQGRHVFTTPPSGMHPLPFDILPDAVLGRDGLFLTLGENHGPEILEHDMSGRLRRVIRLAEAVMAPSPGDIGKLVEFELDPYDMPDTTRKRLSDLRIDQYQEMPLPKILPVFSRLLVDDVGWLWAELYRFDVRQPARWLVFGPTGEGVGSVDLPPDLDVRQIGRDFVLGVWEDELGVDYVRRHALIGRGEGGLR